jgi:WD40-like Beta Propeller Repeat
MPPICTGPTPRRASRSPSTGESLPATVLSGAERIDSFGTRTGQEAELWQAPRESPHRLVFRFGSWTVVAPVGDPGEAAVLADSLTEDDYDGRLYRFRPLRYGDLSEGTLEAASVGAGDAVTWITIPPSKPYRGRDTTAFDCGEGAWISRNVLFFSTTSNDRVWALDLGTMQIKVIYDGQGADVADPLHEPDNITVHEPTGHGFVAEDDDDIQLVQLVSTQAGWEAVPFLQFVGHDGSEVAGPVFSPDGRRLYVSSQRGRDGDGMTFEIIGPFARR